MPRSTDANQLVASAADGSIRAVARLLTWVETGGDRAAQVSAALAGRARAATVWGLTGPPGVGKSTITAALIADARQSGHTVAVLAVDPSSPFSGGALLGDRVRMVDHVTDQGVFIRSMASRGHLGGLSPATTAAVDLMSAIGFHIVLVETVGVGQNEIDVLRLADSVVVITAPGAGDGIQAAKAGILEVADILVVNKSDREGAATTVRELKSMVAMGRSGTTRTDSWRTPVLATTASTGIGITDLVAALLAHGEYSVKTGAGLRKARTRSAVAMETLVLAQVHRLLNSEQGRSELASIASEVAELGGDTHRGAEKIWTWLRARP